MNKNAVDKEYIKSEIYPYISFKHISLVFMQIERIENNTYGQVESQ
jgi:hypothetical protein